MAKPYAPRRIWLAFRFLHTVFVLVLKKDRFLFLSPLPPRPLKEAILTLGVSYIKLAQVLATRADFFSADYLAELRTIHDEVAPMDRASLDTVYRRAFGDAPPFAGFNPEPIASASIGQVHEAYLPSGERVAVKLRRLGIPGAVKADIRILRGLLGLFEPFFSRSTKNSLDAVISEFAAMIAKESDLSVELANLSKFAETYADSEVRFPVALPELSNADALVMRFEEGVRIDDHEALRRLGIPFRAVLNRLIDFYIEQMLVKGYFHADPHPGNILVRADGGLTLIDFGMVKRLPGSARLAMIELAKAAHERDFELFIAACKRLGIVAPAAPEAEMMEFSERMFDIFSNEALSAASMQALAFSVMSSMKDLPFKVPQDVVYVMRASTLVEGLGTTTIENFNGIKDILPMLKERLPRALGVESGLFPTIREEFASLPLTVRRMKTVLTDLSESNLRVRLAAETLEYIGEKLLAALKPAVLGVLLMAAAFFLAGFDIPRRGLICGTLFVLGALRVLTALR